MKIIDVKQGSPNWAERRAGLVTASEMDALVSPTGEIRRGQTPASYLARKLAEKWAGPLFGGGGELSFFTEQGKLLEKEIIPTLEFEHGWRIDRPGLILTDDEKAGCSPDGMIGDICGVEVKAPAADTHVKYLLNGVVPPEYTLQVQGSMFVTGCPSWLFCSYRRSFPMLLLTIRPDEEIQSALREALEQFHAKFEAGWKRLVDLNGGEEPPKRQDNSEQSYAAFQAQLERDADNYRANEVPVP